MPYQQLYPAAHHEAWQKFHQFKAIAENGLYHWLEAAVGILEHLCDYGSISELLAVLYTRNGIRISSAGMLNMDSLSIEFVLNMNDPKVATKEAAYKLGAGPYSGVFCA